MEKSKRSIDLLLFAEDPGGGNFLAPLVPLFQKRGWTWHLVAAGFARGVFADAGLRFEDCYEGRRTARDIISQYNPKVLLVGTAQNPHTLGLLLVDEAKKQGIKTVGVIDAFMNARFRFSGTSNDPRAYAPHFVLVADESTKSKFEALGFSKGDVMVCGHPLYDRVLAVREVLEKTPTPVWRRRYFPKVPEDQKIVTFLDEGAARIMPMSTNSDGGFTGYTGRAAGRTELVLEEFIMARNKQHPRPFTVLRMHPKDNLDDFRDYLSEVDEIHEGGQFHEMLMACDLVVGATTMGLTEAALLGRKTLSIVPNRCEGEWLPDVRENVTPCVTTRAELEDRLQVLLTTAEVSPPEMTGTFVSNGSAERATALLESLIK